MSIDIERLKTDAAYWDDLKAPEDATHACIYLGGKWQWMKVNLSGPFNYYWHKRFSEWRRQESEVGERIIPRPTKPAAPEWDGEGLPPVGAELDYVIGDDRYPVTVVGHFDGEVVVFQHESAPDYVGVRPGYLQPIITKEQRHRDDLANYLGDLLTSAGWEPDMRDAGDLADAILSRYNLGPKDA